MRKGFSDDPRPASLPGFIAVCGLIAMVLAEFDICLAARAGHLVPAWRVLVPAVGLFTTVLAAAALGLALPLHLCRRWCGHPVLPWRFGVAAFVFIAVFLAAEYYATGELLGWADFGPSGIRLSPSIRAGEEGKAFLAAAGIGALMDALLSRFFRSGLVLLCFMGIVLPPLSAVSSRKEPGGDGGWSNLVLVTIDTLRADFIGCYGAREARTPFIDSLARDGVVFERAYTASSLTGPSHASLMSALFPRSHGVLYNGWSIAPDIVTLPRVLSAAGYRTGAVVHALPLDRKYGFDRGFDQFLKAYREETFTMAFLDRVHLLTRVYDEPGRRGGHVIEMATSWLKRHGDAPFFLWIHLYDVHEPYAPPTEFVNPSLAGMRSEDVIAEGRADPTAVNIERLRGLYSGEVRYVDHLLGEFWESLQNLGIAGRTCLVVTSDHGEELLDHEGNVGHARFLYRSVSRVPLILYNVPLPGHPVHIVPDIVPTIDIMPTLLDLLGLAVPESIQGESLVPLLTGSGSSPGYAVSETYLHDGSLLKISLVDGTRHFLREIATGRTELFDLRRDSREVVNLAAESPGAVDAFARRLNRWEEMIPKRVVGDSLRLDPMGAEAFKALGYLR